MKCDELTQVENPCGPYYDKYEVDAAIKELKEEVNNLLMQNSELCQALQVMYSAEEYTILQDENAELKAVNAYQLTTNTEDSDVYIHNDEFGCGGVLVECYLKSEADKVIAHNKYKRCLAMARWCISTMVFNSKYGTDKKWHLFKKWNKRWLELAEKFKESK